MRSTSKLLLVILTLVLIVLAVFLFGKFSIKLTGSAVESSNMIDLPSDQWTFDGNSLRTSGLKDDLNCVGVFKVMAVRYDPMQNSLMDVKFISGKEGAFCSLGSFFYRAPKGSNVVYWDGKFSYSIMDAN